MCRVAVLAGSVDAVIVPGMACWRIIWRLDGFGACPSGNFSSPWLAAFAGSFVLLAVGAKKATNPLTQGLI